MQFVSPWKNEAKLKMWSTWLLADCCWDQADPLPPQSDGKSLCQACLSTDFFWRSAKPHAAGRDVAEGEIPEEDGLLLTGNGFEIIQNLLSQKLNQRKMSVSDKKMSIQFKQRLLWPQDKDMKKKGRQPPCLPLEYWCRTTDSLQLNAECVFFFLKKVFPGFFLFLLNLHNKIKDLLRRVLDDNPILGLFHKPWPFLQM